MTRHSVSPGGLSAAVLVGGESRRLGRDKVLLEIDGVPLIQRCLSLLIPLFAEVLVIGHQRPEFDAMGIEALEDIIPGKGALGGIYTAVVTADKPAVFVMAADMPFVTAQIITRIVKSWPGADAVIPRGPKGNEPLCALYSANCKGSLKGAIDRDDLKIMAALDGLKVVKPRVTVADGESDPFANINYPEDWEELKERV